MSSLERRKSNLVSSLKATNVRSYCLTEFVTYVTVLVRTKNDSILVCRPTSAVLPSHFSSLLFFHDDNEHNDPCYA